MKPNYKKFMETLNNAVDNFLDSSKKQYKKIISISHNDADGISSLEIIQNLLYKMQLENDYFIFNRSTSWENYLNGILPKTQKPNLAFIFTDIGSALSELVPIIKRRKEDFYILDHHEVEYDEGIEDLPENLFFVNPTIFGYDGLDHIAGATLTFMFSKMIKKSMLKYGWLTIIGIAGDSLRSMDKLESFNREIYIEMVEEEIVEDKKGLILFGSMHDTIKNGLKFSILPYVRGLGGAPDQEIKSFLNKLSINPNKKIVELNNSEISKLKKELKLKSGSYALLPQKQGMLKFAFEHALLLNILSFKNINAALSIIRQRTITRQAKEIYKEYIINLVQNLRTLTINAPKIETKKAIFIDAGNVKIPPSNWSDTASFCAVNELFSSNKMLFLGGLEKKTNMMKLSIRCTRNYLKNHDNLSVNNVISRIKEIFGGSGGGHKLAGGIRISVPSYKQLIKKIDEIL